MPTIYRVYVLQNDEGKFYIGLSDNVTRRSSEQRRVRTAWITERGPWPIYRQSEVLLFTAAGGIRNRRVTGGQGKGLSSTGWCSKVGRQARNLRVAGSNPAPATKPPECRQFIACTCFRMMRVNFISALATMSREGVQNSVAYGPLG